MVVFLNKYISKTLQYDSLVQNLNKIELYFKAEAATCFLNTQLQILAIKIFIMQTSLSVLMKQAKEILQSVENNPNQRLELRKNFYRKYGFGKITEFGYGNSEIAFLEWEIKRGVLNSLDDSQHKGSAWWRGVNGHFIYLATLAQLIYESGQSFDNIPIPVQYWLEYLKNPSSQSWYKAHNCSIVEGYLICELEAAKESYYELVFVNMVLYRVLFAEALVEGKEFGKLGKIIANPRLPSVEVAVEIPDFYPQNYPLSEQDIIDVMHRGHSLVDLGIKILDLFIILPQLDELYLYSAEILQQPCLKKWTVNDKPCYCIVPKKTFLGGIYTKILDFFVSLFRFTKKIT